MQLEITERIPIIKDFPVFIDYLEENEIQLTRTKEKLKGPTLYELNQLMSYSVPDISKRSRQRIYPVLHLFYHLSLEGRLFEKVKEGSKMFLRPTERLEQYQQLNLTEKYFFLLETFWVDCDWDKLQESNFGTNPLGQVCYVVEDLNQEFIGKEINLSETRFRLFGWGYFLIYLEYFGFWEVTYKEADSKTTYLAKTIKLSQFGYTMLNLLVKNRDLDLWNLPQRRKLGDFKGCPGASLTVEQEDDLLDELFFMLGQEADLPSKEEVLTKIEGGNDKDEDQAETGEDQAEEEFIAAFKSIFPDGALVKTLTRAKDSFKEGKYIVIISSNKNNWCRIKFAAEHTLENVHKMIENHFDLWDDHLYAFFLDGEAWSDEVISCSRDTGPDTTNFQLGELNLKEGQEIMYIFDYGAECRFQIKVEEINDDQENLSKPQII